MKLKVYVYSKEHRAKEIIDNLIDILNIKENEIIKYHQGVHSKMYVETEHITIRNCSFNDMSKGHKCHFAIVDEHEVSNRYFSDILKGVVYSSLTPSYNVVELMESLGLELNDKWYYSWDTMEDIKTVYNIIKNKEKIVKALDKF